MDRTTAAADRGVAGGAGAGGGGAGGAGAGGGGAGGERGVLIRVW